MPPLEYIQASSFSKHSEACQSEYQKRSKRENNEKQSKGVA